MNRVLPNERYYQIFTHNCISQKISNVPGLKHISVHVKGSAVAGCRVVAAVLGNRRMVGSPFEPGIPLVAGLAGDSHIEAADILGDTPAFPSAPAAFHNLHTDMEPDQGQGSPAAVPGTADTGRSAVAVGGQAARSHSYCHRYNQVAPAGP